MPKDKTINHEKIVDAAFQEFLTYGFKEASMRRIAKECGMSASGLYRHFPRKEDMFSSLVCSAYDGFVEMYTNNSSEIKEQIHDIDVEALFTSSDETLWFMEYIYDHFDAFKLIICRSEGTRYENYAHDLAQIAQSNTVCFMNAVREKGVVLKDYDEMELHLLTTTYIDALFQPVRHDFPREKALHYGKTLDEFFNSSWKNFFGI